MSVSTLFPAQLYAPFALEAARTVFLRDNPGYAATARLRDLRATEYARLDRQGHTYLDYTGGGLYAEGQVRRHLDLLQENVFGNPHSVNPTSMAATRLVDAARAYVYKFFRASPEEYTVIFTANASGALKLVGEAYPFAPGSRYLLTFDNHNSVNGIREFAQAKGAEVLYLPVVPPDLRISQERLEEFLGKSEPGQANLFAFPAQSNFSGVQHPLELIAQAHAAGWDVLLDGAAFTPTNRLDLSLWKPDFVSLSFYKIFGYPTGVGCLLARKDALKKLCRPWFAGGTITIASVQGCGHYLADSEAAFEDGTVDYLNLPAIHIGLEYIDSIGMELIHNRVVELTGWLLKELAGLCHSNGAPLVRIYGPTDTACRGGTIAFNFYDPDAVLVDYHKVEQLANSFNISLRTGCFCNPGAGELAHGLTTDEMREAFQNEERMTLEQFQAIVLSKHKKSAGAVRVSLGIASNFADVYRFLGFAAGFLDRPAEGQ
ncbi:MAG: aminotransferase class V-fold PLP-dependent enzyme [Caldilineaceae bacterium]|nr:aminotransferase class V-fold PLP-dependent enzyme [Caldilineaceae bacterium]